MLELPYSPASVYVIHVVLVGVTLWFIRSVEASLVSSVQRILVQLAAILLLAAFTFSVSEPPRLFEDFREAYFAAGRAVLDGPGALIAQLHRGIEGFVNLPIVAFLFAPFALLPPKAAALSFAMVGVASVGIAWWLICKTLHLERGMSMMLLAIFAACGPMHNSLKEGNTSHMVLALLAGALWAIKQRREFTAGAVLAFAAVLKLPLLLLGAYFLLRRRWRIVAGGAIVCALVVGLSLLIFGWSVHVVWYSEVLAPYSDGQVLAFNVQSVRAFVARFFIDPAVLWDWSLRPLPLQVKILANFVSLALAAISVLVLARRQQGACSDEALSQEFSIVLVLACLLSPLSWSHYYAWLLIPAATLMAQSAMRSSYSARAVVYFSITLLLLPIVAAEPHIGATWVYAKIFVSHLFFAGLLLLILLLRAGAQRRRLPSAPA